MLGPTLLIGKSDMGERRPSEAACRSRNTQCYSCRLVDLASARNAKPVEPAVNPTSSMSVCSTTILSPYHTALCRGTTLITFIWLIEEEVCRKLFVFVASEIRLDD